MKTAYLYIRVSTDEQADTGYSQRHQEETLRRYCEINKIIVKQTVFEDHSAKTFNRPAFQQLLVHINKAKRDRADLLLFTKWDRFSRNAGDAYQMISKLGKLGIEPQAIEQPLNLEIPENKMMLAFYLAAPEVENDRRSLNIRGGMRRARKEGRYMGKAPLGYRNMISPDGKTKWIEPDPVQGPIMKWAFEEIARGQMTVRSVMLKCQEMGLKTHARKDVCKTPFWNAIRNPVYMGKVRIEAAKGEEEQLVPGKHQPLISAALFYQAQEALDGKKKVMKTKVKVDEDFPLRGFLQCPRCGKPLTASRSKGRTQYYKYYHCTGGCPTRHTADQVNGDLVKELARWKPHEAVGALYELLLQDVLGKQSLGRKKELEKIQDELHRLTEHKVRIRKLLINGDLPADDYRAEKEETEQAIALVEGRIADLAQGTDYSQQLRECYSLLSNVDKYFLENDVEWQRDLIGSMFPEKLEYTETGFRTARVNEVAAAMFNMGAAFSKMKMGHVEEISDMSHLVDPLVHFSNHFAHDLKKLVHLAETSKFKAA